MNWLDKYRGCLLGPNQLVRRCLEGLIKNFPVWTKKKALKSSDFKAFYGV